MVDVAVDVEVDVEVDVREQETYAQSTTQAAK
jgi:hypothetical protein